MKIEEIDFDMAAIDEVLKDIDLNLDELDLEIDLDGLPLPDFSQLD